MDEALGNHGLPVAGTDFLHKPFTVDDVLRCVRQALDRPPAQARPQPGAQRLAAAGTSAAAGKDT